MGIYVKDYVTAEVKIISINETRFLRVTLKFLSRNNKTAVTAYYTPPASTVLSYQHDLEIKKIKFRTLSGWYINLLNTESHKSNNFLNISVLKPYNDYLNIFCLI